MRKDLTKALERADKLEKLPKIIRKVVANIDVLRQSSDDYIRLMLNNQRLRFDLPYAQIYMCRQDLNKENSYRMESREKYQILCQLAGSEDPLSKKIVEYIGDKQRGFYNYVLSDSEIPAKLATRTMTEEEYMGYLNGKIPIAIINKKRYFLPKKKKKRISESTRLGMSSVSSPGV